MKAPHRNKVVLVTGCSSGIGKATATRLALDGHDVYATGRSLDRLAALRSENYGRDNIHLLELDVTAESSVAAAVAQIVESRGTIDVVVNNAGASLIGTVEMLTIEEVTAVFDVNFLGVIRVLHEVLPLMRTNRSGHIINISSAAGIVGLPGIDAYVASKFALEGLSEALWYELSSFGIRVSIIEPGAVTTGLLDKTPAGTRLSLERNPYWRFIQDVIAAYKRKFAARSQSPMEIAELVSRIIADPTSKLRCPTSILVKREISRVRKHPSSSRHLSRFVRMIRP